MEESKEEESKVESVETKRERFLKKYSAIIEEDKKLQEESLP